MSRKKDKPVETERDEPVSIESMKPVGYTAQLAEEICIRVALGENLNAISRDPRMPSNKTMHSWRSKHEEFSNNYAHAREARADARSERIDSITEQMLQGLIEPNAARVAIDALKWQAGKEQPKKYGDKLTLDGDLKVTMPEDQLDSRLGALLAKAATKPNADTVH